MCRRMITAGVTQGWRREAQRSRVSTSPPLVIGGGLAASFVIPMLLSWLLPAPVKWFPAELRDIADARVLAETQKLEATYSATSGPFDVTNYYDSSSRRFSDY